MSEDELGCEDRMIKSVKVGPVDTTYFGFGGRILTITPKRGDSFFTPTRPISIPELKSKQFLAFNELLGGCLGGVQIDVKGERYHRFMKRNGTVVYTRRTMTKFSDMSCCSENFAILDVPPIRATDEYALKLLLDMQVAIRTLKNISLPPLEISRPSEMTPILRWWIKDAEQFEKSIVPQVRIDDEPEKLRAKLKILTEMAESDEFHIVNLIYANPDTHPHQYATIWEQREKRVLFNCSGVPSGGRFITLGMGESPIVAIQRYGIDTYTRRTSTISPRYYAWLQHQPAPQSIDEIDGANWQYHPGAAVLEWRIWESLPSENVECRCKVCRGREQREIIDEYCHDEQGTIVKNGLDKASKLHDALSSEMEYVKVKKMIKSQEMAEYASEAIKYRNNKLKPR